MSTTIMMSNEEKKLEINELVTQKFLNEWIEYLKDEKITMRYYESHNLCQTEKNFQFAYEDLLFFLERDSKKNRQEKGLSLRYIFQNVEMVDSSLLRSKIKEIYVMFMDIANALYISVPNTWGRKFLFVTSKKETSIDKLWGEECSEEYDQCMKMSEGEKKSFQMLELIMRPKFKECISDGYAGIEFELDCTKSEFEIYRRKILNQLIEFFKEKKFSQVVEKNNSVIVYWTNDLSKRDKIKKESFDLRF